MNCSKLYKLTTCESSTRKSSLVALRRQGLAALVLAVALAASAQQGSPTPASPSIQNSPAARQARPGVSPEQALYLVRSTLLALNDANRSGNYAALRDMAAPDFQARNSPVELAQIFADLRRRKFDLFAVALLAPQFTAEPALDASGKLRMTGFFATHPQRIRFHLTFERVNEEWRLYTVGVATPEAPAVQSRFNTPVPRHTAGTFYALRAWSGIVGRRW